MLNVEEEFEDINEENDKTKINEYIETFLNAYYKNLEEPTVVEQSKSGFRFFINNPHVGLVLDKIVNTQQLYEDPSKGKKLFTTS